MRSYVLVPLAGLLLAASAACSATGSASAGSAPAPGASAPAPGTSASTPGAPAPTASVSAPASGGSASSGGASAGGAGAAAATAPATKAATGGYATFPIAAGTHLVLLRSYDDGKHTAVVESNGGRYTLPVDPSFRVFSTNGGNPACMNGTGSHTTGSCLAGTDWLRQQLRENDGGLPVEIANTGDFIYEISEQYRP